MKNDLCFCIAIVLDTMAAAVAAARWQTCEHQTCPNVVLPAGLCLVSGRRRDKSVLVSEASVLPLQRRDVEAPEGRVTRLIPRLKKKK